MTLTGAKEVASRRGVATAALAKAAAVAVALTGVVAAPLVVAGAAPTEAVAAAASTMAASTEAVVAAIRFGPVRSRPGLRCLTRLGGFNRLGGGSGFTRPGAVGGSSSDSGDSSGEVLIHC